MSIISGDIVTRALSHTLAMVAQAASEAAHDWWIIGSAAARLHGCDVPHLKDVDLLMSAADASTFLENAGTTPHAGTPNSRFRSEVFGTWAEPPVPVEVMGGFKLATPSGWRDVTFSTREAITVGGQRVFVPALHEFIDLLNAFGRTKDQERARLLSRDRAPASALQSKR